MPTVSIHGTKLNYDPSDVITLAEGLIGMPGIRRLVLVRQEQVEPFLWLASLDLSGLVFLVVEPHAIFPDYQLPAVPEGADLLILSLVTLARTGADTTVNLRAPLVINRATKRGLQTVLTDTDYSLTAPLPPVLMAA